MTAYICLIAFLFIARSICNTGVNKERSNKLFTAVAFLYIYILCVVRSFNVGIDIPGYITIYDITATVSWDSWDYVYFENGYIALMKICNMLGLSARGFFYVAYAIILFPIYHSVRKFSTDPFLSVILFVCFMFFTFDLTGLRQAIGMSICLYAFSFMIRDGILNMVVFFLLVLLASTFHTSARVFLPAYFIVRLRLCPRTIVMFAIVAVLCSLFNEIGVQRILEVREHTHYHYTESARLGLSLVLYFIFAICSILAHRFLSKTETSSDIEHNYETEFESYYTLNLKDLNKACALMLCTSVVLAFLFNGSVLLRANMYYLQLFIIAIPIYFSTLDKPTRFVGKVLLICVMLLNFFLNDLSSFNLVPYELGVEQSITKYEPRYE